MEDIFNEGMSFITHVIANRSQMLLTFSRHHMMYNVSYVALLHVKGASSYINKAKNKIKD